MAADISKNTVASSSGKTATASGSGFSYANAVLNFKNRNVPPPSSASAAAAACSAEPAEKRIKEKIEPLNDKSNKENEHVKANVNVRNNAAVAADNERSSDSINFIDNLDNESHGGDREDGFIDYSGSKRKKKMAKMKKKEVAFTLQNASSGTTSTVGGVVAAKSSPIRHDRIRDRRRSDRPSLASATYVDENESNNAVTCDNNVEYVEAPVPKVNPWTIKRNSTVAATIRRSENDSSCQTECK